MTDAAIVSSSGDGDSDACDEGVADDGLGGMLYALAGKLMVPWQIAKYLNVIYSERLKWFQQFGEVVVVKLKQMVLKNSNSEVQ